MGLNDRWADVVIYLQSLGAGYTFLKTLLEIPETLNLPWTEYAKDYKGSEKKFNEAVAEWSDGDSVASHIASGIDYFCTYDEAKGAGSNSVFSSRVKNALKAEFGQIVLNPSELIAIMGNR